MVSAQGAVALAGRVGGGAKLAAAQRESQMRMCMCVCVYVQVRVEQKVLCSNNLFDW